MTKSLKYIVLIAILILLTFYFMLKPTLTNTLINEETLVEQPDKHINSPIPDNLKDKFEIKQEITHSEMEIEISKAKEKSVSYLTAYRELKLFKKCRELYETKQKGINLIEDYTQSYVHPNETQLHYYQIHIDQCFSLLTNDNEDASKASKRLSNRFKDISPESKEEIALSLALEIKSNIIDVLRQIGKEKNGRHKLTKAQIAASTNKANVLIAELNRIYKSNPDGLDEANQSLVSEHLNQIVEIHRVKDHVPNQEEISYLQEQYKTVVIELKEFFRNNQTPDVFLIFADYLLNPRKERFFFTDDLNNKLSVYDKSYINNLNKIIVPFMACSLGYPCGPESYLSIKHCIYPHGYEPKACGKSIEDYYLEDLIGPNQLIDFNTYFNYLLENHAKI